MLRVRVDSREINKILDNTIKYSYGFVEGVKANQIFFNSQLADYTIDVLNKYIDSQAKANPDALHHIYEWGMVGSESGRLFSITPRVSLQVIHFEGKFLKSSSETDSGYVFSDKAEIMENGISVVVEPKNSPVLAFEDDGETVFTTSSIYIAHPGGDDVAGSFGRVVEEFFGTYFTSAFMQPLLRDLATADEYAKMFPQGARGGGRAAGIVAGKKYLDIKALGAIE